MIYIYDGTYEGLLSAIFLAYPQFNQGIRIEDERYPVKFFDKVKKIDTDEEQAQRVEKYVEKNLGPGFLMDIYYVFLSDHEERHQLIFYMIYHGTKLGRKIKHVMTEEAVLFRKIKKRVSSERHSFLGFIRFSELEDGVLYAKIEPENDILTLLIKHFRERLPAEKWMIHDLKRKKALYYRDYSWNIFPLDTPLESHSVDGYQEAWKAFYDSIAIEERKNPALMQANMPKKYWKHLTERQ